VVNSRPKTGVCPPRVPADSTITPHRAYCLGLEASRGQVDLSTVVTDALLRWPGEVPELAELIACASLGYWVEGGRP
jgi:hypothetical protein